MSFLSTFKTVSNRLNAIARAMDEKVDTFVDQALDIVVDYDGEYFNRGKNGEADREDMKQAFKKLFAIFEAESKKKSINGYILFTKENRQDCSQRNPDMSPTQITSALSQEWKALEQSERDEWNTRAKSVAPQSEEEKRAKRSSSKKPAAPKVTCEYSGCDKAVKNPTQHTDGCVYCATHFKKVVSDEKKASTPKCQHSDKEGKECKSDALNGEWCSRHMKKPSEDKNSRNEVAQSAAKSTSKKPIRNEVAMSEANEKKEEKKTPSVKASSAPKTPSTKPAEAPKTPVVSPATDKFNFKRESPVDISESPDWWVCKAIKLDGVNKNRYHVKTGLVLDLSQPKLIGTFINNKPVFLQDVNEEVKEWCRKSGITVEEEDMDIELDEELESEDEE
jgi:hypothetical protein